MLLFTVLVFKEEVKYRFFLHKAACRSFSCRSQTVHLATFQKKTTTQQSIHTIPSITHQTQQCCSRTPSGLCTYHILLLRTALGWQRAQRPSSQLRRGRSFLPGGKRLHAEGNRVNAVRVNGVFRKFSCSSHFASTAHPSRSITHLYLCVHSNQHDCTKNSPAEFCSSAPASDDGW